MTRKEPESNAAKRDGKQPPQSGGLYLIRKVLFLVLLVMAAGIAVVFVRCWAFHGLNNLFYCFFVESLILAQDERWRRA